MTWGQIALAQVNAYMRAEKAEKAAALREEKELIKEEMAEGKTDLVVYKDTILIEEEGRLAVFLDLAGVEGKYEEKNGETPRRAFLVKGITYRNAEGRRVGFGNELRIAVRPVLKDGNLDWIKNFRDDVFVIGRLPRTFKDMEREHGAYGEYFSFRHLEFGQSNRQAFLLADNTLDYGRLRIVTKDKLAGERQELKNKTLEFLRKARKADFSRGFEVRDGEVKYR